MSNRIIAVHLLNDRSGSPLVLKQALDVLKQEHRIVLYTATPSGDGFLNEVEGITRKNLFYMWHPNKLITLFFFLFAQCLLFFRLLFALRSGDTVYINTLLPFGAATAGYIRRAKVVYHIHEVSLKPAPLKNMLVNVATQTASKFIFVSEYVASRYNFTGAEVIHNALPASFVQNASLGYNTQRQDFTVTMLCSLKTYKGINHFVGIARKMPVLKFVLVLNASESEVAKFKADICPPKNCTILSAVKDSLLIYRMADVVMNLSRMDGWIETFGMTVLEAMQCGKPVIVPPVGGVCELVTDGVEGYRIDSRDEDAIADKLYALANNHTLYRKMADAALNTAGKFGAAAFQTKILKTFSPASFQKATPVFRISETLPGANSL